MALGQAERHLVERRLHRRDLLEDVRAPAVVLEHALDPARLPFDAAEPREQLVLVFRVAPAGWRDLGRRHARDDTPRGYARARGLHETAQCRRHPAEPAVSPRQAPLAPLD